MVDFSKLEKGTEWGSLTPKMVDLYNEAKADLNIELYNIREKSMIISSLRLKWSMLLFREKNWHESLQQKYDTILKNKADEHENRIGKKIPRAQLEKFLSAKDEELLTLDKQITASAALINLLSPIADIFRDFGHTVRNSLESIKVNDLG
jgi:hypothetical protein